MIACCDVATARCGSQVHSAAAFLAGRAGRKGTEYEDGCVTTKEPGELPHVADALNLPLSDMTASHAGLMPMYEQVWLPVCNALVLERTSTLAGSHGSRANRTALSRSRCLLLQVEAYAHEQGYPDVCLYSSVLHHFALEASQDELYSLSKHDQMQAVAETLDDVLELTLYERHQFCTAPVDTRKAQVFNAFLAFVERCAAMRQHMQLIEDIHVCFAFSSGLML